MFDMCVSFNTLKQTKATMEESGGLELRTE